MGHKALAINLSDIAAMGGGLAMPWFRCCFLHTCRLMSWMGFTLACGLRRSALQRLLWWQYLWHGRRPTTGD
ncbi:hypothetical protein [Dictyobacter kobayashii]|uniref:hypothetical protein n=1 Tax=Dictyobacter kobayashii TaxID=2014872 RepID=UPI003FCE05F2